MLVSGRENSRLTFSESVEALPPGRTTLKLFCPVSVAVTSKKRLSHQLCAQSATAGTYSLHSGQAKLARLTLQWTYAPHPVGKGHKPKTLPSLVHVPKDPQALDVQLRRPQRSGLLYDYMRCFADQLFS